MIEHGARTGLNIPCLPPKKKPRPTALFARAFSPLKSTASGPHSKSKPSVPIILLDPYHPPPPPSLTPAPFRGARVPPWGFSQATPSGSQYCLCSSLPLTSPVFNVVVALIVLEFEVEVSSRLERVEVEGPALTSVSSSSTLLALRV